MKKYLLFLLLIACGERKTEFVLTPQEFDAQYKSTDNAILLDVRTPEELVSGKIANAENIVWDDSFANNLSTLDNKPIFIYCHVYDKIYVPGQVSEPGGVSHVVLMFP